MFIGFDLSTQSLSAIVINEKLDVVKEESVNFEKELTSYGTKDGVIKSGEGGNTVTSPTLMWIEALDLLFSKLQGDGFKFSEVFALSVSGQQHGSVYWKTGARSILDNLDPQKPLKIQLSNAFSITDSPIWMDTSTTKYCQELENLVGGAEVMANKTGARSFERFTINQVAKISREKSSEYKQTERISLVSSFFVSLFISGRYADIDTSDAAGMNAMNILSKQWEMGILEYAASPAAELAAKLGPVSASYGVAGTIASYYIKRYGFKDSCTIINGSGDNPCTLAGLKLQVGDIAVSLGTSSTLFGPLIKPVPSHLVGTIMCDPVQENGYMGMIVYKNGALAREKIRNDYAEKDWAKFSQILSSSPIGNNGKIGFFFPDTEIYPLVQGIFLFDNNDNKVANWENPSDNIRGIVESQFMAMRLHAQKLGLTIHGKILATGGGSQNKAIVQVMSDVFGVPVYTGDLPKAAALGAAYKALHGWNCHKQGKFVPFTQVVGATEFQKAADPQQGCSQIYESLLARYAKLETIISGQN